MKSTRSLVKAILFSILINIIGLFIQNDIFDITMGIIVFIWLIVILETNREENEEFDNLKKRFNSIESSLFYQDIFIPNGKKHNYSYRLAVFHLKIKENGVVKSDKYFCSVPKIFDEDHNEIKKFLANKKNFNYKNYEIEEIEYT